MGTILYNAQPGTSDAALYTATVDTVLTKLIAYNTTGGAATVTLTVVRKLSGATETYANAVSIGASAASSLLNDRLLADGEIILYPGDSLHGLASAGTTVNVLAFS